MQATASELEVKLTAARAASRRMAAASGAAKDAALREVAEALVARQEEILAANAADYAEAKATGLSEAMLDRLRLTAPRLAAQAADVRRIADLPDVIGEMFDVRVRPNGLQVGRRRVPLGVIGTVYESRPNVTVDISVLCLKSGNCVVLRGGKEARRTNHVLAGLITEAARSAGLAEGCVQFIESGDRALVGEMLAARGLIDLMVPRGSADLIRYVYEHATMPVVAGGIGVCHTYVDRTADLDKALATVDNAKVRRPSVCNALDTVLVHADIAPAYLPRLAARWAEAGVEMRCEPRARALLAGAPARVVPAAADDFGREFLALVASVKVVDSLDEALAHIETYSSGHSEAIITEDYSAANRFLAEVDAAAVYVNASTGFTDGGEFGLGAEVGISTQKMHARGPMGLREMTSYKWIILGDGQTRP
jgi:glutamate-5-semialdehyde dehydrogenase